MYNLPFFVYIFKLPISNKLVDDSVRQGEDIYINASNVCSLSLGALLIIFISLLVELKYINFCICDNASVLFLLSVGNNMSNSATV